MTGSGLAKPPFKSAASRLRGLSPLRHDSGEGSTPKKVELEQGSHAAAGYEERSHVEATGDTPSRALQVVQELHAQYEKQRQRWRDYMRLISFLAFVAVLLAVLFMQRKAQTAYQVHATIKNGFVPTDPTTGDVVAELDSASDVLTWLSTTLTSLWVDPVCGDGVCERPFEFASYGRFGCRADCGRLSEVQNLTAIQIDLYYDFDHPVGSIPATELMSQAAWNLCPVAGAPHGMDCYYQQDQSFSSLAGSVSLTLTDIPDGSWQVQIKRDLFNKIQGGVRVAAALATHSTYVKIRIALEAADVQRRNETALLSNVADLASQPLLHVIRNGLQAQYRSAVASLDAQLAVQLLNQTTYEERVADARDVMTGELTSLETAAALCPDLPFFAPNVSVDPNAFYNPLSGVNETAQQCSVWGNVSVATAASRFSTIRAVLNSRISKAQTAAMERLQSLLAALQSGTPEVYAQVMANTGQDPWSYPLVAGVNQLADFYVEGNYSVPPPARAALSRPNVNNPNITLDQIVMLCNDRIQEIAAARSTIMTQRAEVLAALAEPEATTAYNVAAWSGGLDSYKTCRLGSRAPDYVGSCTPRINCTETVTPVGSLQNIVWSCPGTSLVSDDCSDACEAQDNCDALCVCFSADENPQECLADQVCECPGCLGLTLARQDPNFIALYTPGPATSLPPPPPAQGRRKLQATSPVPPRITDLVVQQMLASVSSLQAGQSQLQANLDTLSSTVQAANAAAAARATDSSLAQMINAARDDITTGQAATQTLLSQIIGKQNDAVAAAQQAAQSLAAIQSLAAQQSQAEQTIAAAVRRQLDSIKAASQQGLISPSQALELWKSALRDQAQANKLASLSNMPCTTDAMIENHPFSLNNITQAVEGTARDRNIGLNNRVIAGLLIHTTRTRYAPCPDSRFNNIDGQCRVGSNTEPYGVDPVFKQGTSLYNPDFDNPASTVAYYNCSQLPGQATYNVSDPHVPGGVTNPAPFCAELFNPRSLPYGFRHFQLPQLFRTPGFPIWVDINLSQEEAVRLLSYITDGLYLDSSTRSMQTVLVTYNPILQMFSMGNVAFDFNDAGEIRVTYGIHTLRVELYETPADIVRGVLEGLLTVAVVAALALELWGVIKARLRKGSLLAYFQSGWGVVDFISTAFAVACVSLWWDFVLRKAAPFSVQLRYKVYSNLHAPANLLSLADGGAHLQEAEAAFARLQDLVNTLSWYYALNGLNILLLILRVLKLMDFQPRLGVVTRSLALAGPDLMHFCLVCGVVFTGYAMMAHLIFGNSIEKFSSFGRALDTCFAVLLGDISVLDDLHLLSGLQGLAGTLFFWSFELLVFMVLLNFLLAIIVDAFSEVKDTTAETQGIHTEMAQLLRQKWGEVSGLLSRGTHVPEARLAQLLADWAGANNSPAPRGGPAGAAREGESGADADAGGSPRAGRQKATRRRLRVLGEDLSVEELREVLQACLRDFSPESPRPRQGRWWWGSGNSTWAQMTGRAHSTVPTEDELDRAAACMVARFGEVEGEEEVHTASGGDAAPKGGSTSDKEKDLLAATVSQLAAAQRKLAESHQRMVQGQRQVEQEQERIRLAFTAASPLSNPPRSPRPF